MSEQPRYITYTRDRTLREQGIDPAEQTVEDAEDEGPGLTVAELREELKARGLQTSGSKAELEERLASDTIEGQV